MKKAALIIITGLIWSLALMSAQAVIQAHEMYLETLKGMPLFWATGTLFFSCGVAVVWSIRMISRVMKLSLHPA